MKIQFDRAFYRRVFAVAAPIIVQQFITNFVSMLDNVMVGQVGTVPMSGVSMPILPLYLVVSLADIVKLFIGGWMLKKGMWIRRIVE